jgi:GNAT superfamily N-acetyltransferase
MSEEEMSDDLPGVVSDSMARRSAAAVVGRVRPATLNEIVDLRYDVLRAGLPREAAIFEGDSDPTSRHYGAFVEGDETGFRNIGCATLHLNRWLDEPAWQLRGMATAPDFRNAGVGSELLSYVEADLLATHPVHLLWCNARVPAIRFYQRMGWQTVSEEFEIPTAGPHVRMVRRI